MRASGAPAERGGVARAPRRHSRSRLALCEVLEAGARLLGGRRFYRRRHLAPGRVRLRRERLLVPGLPRGLEGFRIAQLSDLHAGPFLGPGDLAHALELARAEEPELAVLTGDLITHSWEEALLVLDDLASLRPRHGFLAVFGNHDYHGRQEDRIAAAYAERGIEFLRNACRRIDTGAGVLAVVGLEDLEEGRVVDLAGARREVREGDQELVLCHNPAGAHACARAGCVAVLSGHSHGHQIDLPLVRRLGPHHPGDRREAGADRAPGSAVVTSIVSRGLGAVCVPLRVRSPAEVVLVELRSAAEAHPGAG